MTDPTGVPGQGVPAETGAERPADASEADPAGAAHLDPPGMPAQGPGSDAGPEAQPGGTAPEQGDGWLEGPPPAAPVDEMIEAPAPRSPSGDRAPPELDFALSMSSPEDDEVTEAVEEGAPAWMMTFGDMMSLLLTFFILLFSMSSIEVEKFRAASESLAEALGESNAGVMPDGAVPVAPPPTPVGEVRDRIVQERIDDVASQLEEFVRENKLEEQVVVSKESHGVFLRMQNQALFRPGSADIATASEAIVEQLGAVLERMNLPVKVSGHTDNVPIRSSVFPSNWELSAARAAGVARILVARGHDPAAIAVEAFGEHQPVASNDTPEGRAENRRVELFFSRLSMEASMDERGELPQVPGVDASVPDAQGSDEAGESDGAGGPEAPAGSDGASGAEAPPGSGASDDEP